VNCYRARCKVSLRFAAYVSHEYSIAARFYSRSCISKVGTLICAVVGVVGKQCNLVYEKWRIKRWFDEDRQL